MEKIKNVSKALVNSDMDTPVMSFIWGLMIGVLFMFSTVSFLLSLLVILYVGFYVWRKDSDGAVKAYFTRIKNSVMD